MKYTKKLLLIIGMLVYYSSGVQAQSKQSIDSLLCKEWRLLSMNIGGENIPVPAEYKNNKMIFYFNHTVKSIEGELIELGVWKYNEVTQSLTIKDNESKENLELKILKLTKEECILEFKEDRETIKIFMVPHAQ